MDYKVDNTGKTLETATINRAITDVSARPGAVCSSSPRVYLTGEIVMQEQRQALCGRGRAASRVAPKRDYVSPPMPGGASPLARAMVVFNNVENAAWRGAAPSIWRATRGCGTTSRQTPATERRARRGAGERSARRRQGYIVNHCKNISFQGLLLRSAYWTTTVSDTENFSAVNIRS